MLEAILLVVICGLGIVFTYPLKNKLSFLLLLVISPLTGGLIWMLIVIFGGLFDLPPDGRIILLICLLTAGAYFLLLRGYKYWKTNVREILIIGIFFVFILISVQVVQSIEDFVFHTTDSFLMIDMGRYWLDPATGQDLSDLPSLREKTQSGAEHLPHMLNAYGFYIPAIQSARLFTSGSILTYFPIMSIGFILAVGILLDRIIKLRTGLQKRTRFLLVLSVLLLMTSNSAYLLHSRYLHSNLAAGVFLALAVLGFALYLLEDETAWLVLSAIMLFGLSFTRTETPIWVLTITTLLVLNADIPTNVRRLVFLPLLLGIALWHLLIYVDVLTFGSGTAVILSPTLLIVLSIAFVMAAIIVYFLDLLPTKLFPLLGSALVAGLIVSALYILNSPKGIQTLEGLLINMGFQRGLWGAYWYLIIPILLFVPSKNNQSADQIMKSITLIGFLLIVVASGFRGVYRPGWSDTGNRMLMHVFPLLTIYLGLKVIIFLNWLQQENNSQEVGA